MVDHENKSENISSIVAGMTLLNQALLDCLCRPPHPDGIFYENRQDGYVSENVYRDGQLISSEQIWEGYEGMLSDEPRVGSTEDMLRRKAYQQSQEIESTRREIEELKKQIKIEITTEDHYYAASELLKILHDEKSKVEKGLYEVDFYINKVHGGKTCDGFEESQKENLEAQIRYLNVFIDVLSKSMEEFDNEYW